MRRLTYLFATLLIGGIILTCCKKNEKTVDPTPESPKIVYKVDNTGLTGNTASDCFTYTISYTGANGNTITVKNVKLPWTSPEITVNLPFTAKIEGDATFNEAELPDVVYYGSIPSIDAGKYGMVSGNGAISFKPKDLFLQQIANNPELLQFSLSKTF
jgi:hypothetical protein